jgi:hypothetical protein
MGTCTKLAVKVLGVPLVLKRNDKIVHKARQIGLSLHMSLRSPLKPKVNNIVKVSPVPYVGR